MGPGEDTTVGPAIFSLGRGCPGIRETGKKPTHTHTHTHIHMFVLLFLKHGYLQTPVVRSFQSIKLLMSIILNLPSINQ